MFYSGTGAHIGSISGCPNWLCKCEPGREPDSRWGGDHPKSRGRWTTGFCHELTWIQSFMFPKISHLFPPFCSEVSFWRIKFRQSSAHQLNFRMSPLALMSSTTQRKRLLKRQMRWSKRPKAWPNQIVRWLFNTQTYSGSSLSESYCSVMVSYRQQSFDLYLSCLKLTYLAGTCGDGAPSRAFPPQSEIRKQECIRHWRLSLFWKVRISKKVVVN